MIWRRTAMALLAAAGMAWAQPQAPVFQVDVKLVRILATVKNASGELVGNLGKDDFEVFDNGVRQQVAVFEHHTEQPLSIALMLDTSASTGIDIRYEIDSMSRFLHAFIKEGNPLDAAKLYAFSYDTRELTDFTRRLETLERSLKGLRSEGGTSLYDALEFAAGALEGREGRRVIVVVTDGGDTTSIRDFHQALQAAQMADAVIYPILVVPITNDAGRNIGGEHALTLLAQGTAGRVFAPTLGEALDQAFTDILRELRTQYLIGYYPKDLPATKEPFHTLQIKLRRTDLRVSARSGYYGESPSSNTKGWKRVR